MDCNELTNHILSIKEKKKFLDKFINERTIDSALDIKRELAEALDNLIKNELSEYFDFYSSQENYNKTQERIIKKIEQGIELNDEEIVFLYDIDLRARSARLKQNPKLKEIIKKERNIKSDISRVTGFKPEEISTNENEALGINVKYHYGNLYLSVLTVRGLTFPHIISGDLFLLNLESANGLDLANTNVKQVYLGGKNVDLNWLRKQFPHIVFFYVG